MSSLDSVELVSVLAQLEQRLNCAKADDGSMRNAYTLGLAGRAGGEHHVRLVEIVDFTGRTAC